MAETETTAEPIRFSFDERKAAEAAAYLLTLEGKRMNYMRLLKLLYLAERQSLATFRRPIIGDTPYSMDQGPVLGRVYDLIKEDKPTGFWGEFIERDTRYEIRLYRTHDQWALGDMTHDFPEWEDPKGSSIEIPIERILEAFKKTDAEVERVRQNAREQGFFDKLFRG